MREMMITFILTQVPKEFKGKENWLGFKLSPHSPMLFINKVEETGVTTNQGFYTYDQCSQETIATVYQRLKWMDYLNKEK